MLEKNLFALPDVVWFQEGPGVRNTQYRTSGVKLLNVANLIDGKVDTSNTDRYISEEEAYGKYSHFLVDEGDLILASSGIKVEYIDKKMGFVERRHLPLCMNTSTIRFRSIDKNVLNIRYFMYFLKSVEFKRQLATSITGSAQLNFGPSHLKHMVISVPRVNYQEQIVQRLDTIDALIDKKKRSLQLLDQLVKSQFIEMFGNPWTNPKEFEIVPLSSLIIKANNGLARRGNDANGQVVLRLVELQSGYLDLSKPNKIFLDDKEKSKYRLVDGDILFARVNGNPENVGRCATYRSADMPEAYHNDHIIRVKVNADRIDSIFLTEFINSSFGRSQLKSHIKTSAGQYTISQEGIGAVNLYLPPLADQKKYREFLEQVDKSKFVVQKSLEELDTLKRSLMQQYFG